MKLILVHYNKITEITTEHDDVDIYEIKELLKQLLLGAGFVESNLKEIFITEE